MYVYIWHAKGVDEGRWVTSCARCLSVTQKRSQSGRSLLFPLIYSDRKNPRLRCFYTTPPPSIPPEQLASGSPRVFRQSSSPVDPAEYPARAARQWIPVLASDPAQYPAKAARQWIPPSIPPAARQWIPPSIPPEQLASGSREYPASGSLVDPAEYPARAARQWIPPPERLARVSRQSC